MMCGRVACTLCKNDLLYATKQYCTEEKMPKWIEKFDWQSYEPSYNIGPQQITPVLVKHATEIIPGDHHDLALVPMKWGLESNWSQSPEHSKVNPFNCRVESVLDLQIFKKAVTANRRCVIIADGFFEWKTEHKTKVPYFIHSPDTSEFSMKMRDWNNTDSFITKEGEWNGPRMLTMAGIYDVIKHPKLDWVYSYSILTMDSSKTIDTIHTRMPAILNDVKDVQMWLDAKNIPFRKAVHCLKPTEKLDFYEVGTMVNSVKNKGMQCVLPHKCAGTQKRITTYFTTEKSGPSKKLKMV